MTKAELMDAFVKAYSIILGRNKYSQTLRGYVYDPYKDGKYYSDCSASQCKAMKKAGMPITYNGSSCPNTVGMYHSQDLVDVPVIIKNGVIQNPEVLQIGDQLLFAGSDSSRSGAGYVGHVEGVYAISNGKVTICGHGSGTPRITEMNAYCKNRYASKTNTRLGHKGLIKVRRHKMLADVDPITDPPKGGLKIKSGTWNMRSGPGTDYPAIGQVKGGTVVEEMASANWHFVKAGNMIGFISDNAIEKE